MTEETTPADLERPAPAAGVAPSQAAIGKPRDPVIAGLASLIQLGLIVCAVGMAWYGVEMTAVTESAIHQIYQLMLFTSGLTLIAIVGVWGAVDALRRSLAP